MRPSRRRRPVRRTSRIESMEPRLFLSANPVGDPFVDYYVESQLHGEVRTSLVDISDLTGLGAVRTDYGFTGAGQTVAVIDTGIAYTHDALGGGFGAGYRVVGGYDFAERDANPYDDGPAGGHGSHVAGILAADDAYSPGVATGVDLVALRVFDDAGQGDFGLVEEALRWVHTNRFAFASPITTVNLSLGTEWNSSVLPDWATLEDELAQLETDGIFIAVAAGNSFASFNQPGLSYPAVSSHVVAVGSVDANGALSYFSQRDARMIAAPGRAVRSTVPDYAGNQNGKDDDFVRYSGTSMASPYVAGAAVLLREAYEFAGMAQVTQDTLYGTMYNTADTIHDAATGLDYRRLNLDRAIDSIMPADDFASSQASAYDLGTVAGAKSLSGTIGRLDDRDWFRFTAAATGSITLTVRADGELNPRWETTGSFAAQAAGQTLTFDVVAGQSYAFGISTLAGLGHYTLDAQIEASSSNVDWGRIAQQRFDGNRVDASGQWYAFTATARGIMTVEAMFDHAAGDVDIELFDARHELVGSSAGTTGVERIDVTAAAGETFYVHAFVYGGGANDRVDFRLTNLVTLDGTAVAVRGTGGDDVFRFDAGSTLRLTINGVDYQFQAADTVRFDGGAGSDTALLVGSAGDDVAVLRAGSAELSGSGYRANVTGVESVTVRAGGGNDRVTFYDSAGNDEFVARPTDAVLAGGGFMNREEGFDVVDAYSTAGGIDTAKLFDSAGNDEFVATPTYAALSGAGFDNRVRFFEGVHAYATAGGIDVAKLFDSAGNDTFVADATSGALFGQGFYNRAKFFDGVHAYATAGGIDTAVLYDSSGNDTLATDRISSALFGAGFYNRAKFFEKIQVHSDSGGVDKAILYDAVLDPGPAKAAGHPAADFAKVAWLYQFEECITNSRLSGPSHVEQAVDAIVTAYWS